MVALANIPALLLPGLRDVTGMYPQIETQYSGLFESGTSEMTVERTVAAAYLPTAYLKTEGAPTTFFNSSGQRYQFNQEHLEIGLGYAFTRKAMDDNLYKTQFRPQNLGLNEAFARTKETIAAGVINNGLTYDPSIGGDGVPLFSTLHPVDGGFVANTFSTQLDLNESAIESALIQIRGFTDYSNQLVKARGKKLAVPRQLEYNAIRLTQTELRPGTANNDINAVKWIGGLSEGYMVMDYLTSSFAWFIKTDQKGLLHLTRVPYETNMWVDDVTNNLLVAGYERYSFNYFDYRAIFGSLPTS